MVLLGSRQFGEKSGLKPRAKIRSAATAGAEPVIMLTAPAAACQRALDKAGMQAGRWAGMQVGDIDLGHPLGATGAILINTALDELERANQSTALTTLCIGGGMGIATIIERV